MKINIHEEISIVNKKMMEVSLAVLEQAINQSETKTIKNIREEIGNIIHKYHDIGRIAGNIGVLLLISRISEELLVQMEVKKKP